MWKNQFQTTKSVWIALLLHTSIICIHAYTEGAPPRMCESMLPGHGEQSMTTDMPFLVSLDIWYIRGSGTITVTVKSIDPMKYSLRGALFVIKKPGNKRDAFGKFDPAGSETDLKTIDCFEKPHTGLTHTNNTPKSMITFQWIVPNVTSAEYELRATLVRDFNNFWEYIHPTKIMVRVDAPLSASASTAVLISSLIFFLITIVCGFSSYSQVR